MELVKGHKDQAFTHKSLVKNPRDPACTRRAPAKNLRTKVQLVSYWMMIVTQKVGIVTVKIHAIQTIVFQIWKGMLRNNKEKLQKFGSIPNSKRGPHRTVPPGHLESKSQLFMTLQTKLQSSPFDLH